MKHGRERKLREMDPRLAQQRIDKLETAISLLGLSGSALRRLNRSDEATRREIQVLVNEVLLLQGRASLPISGRASPKLSNREARKTAPRYFVYLDECGARVSNPQTEFPYFCVAAVAIESCYYEEVVKAKIRDLKGQFWPNRADDIVLHEPDMRRHVGKFYFSNDRARQRAFDDAYRTVLDDCRFYGIGVVVDKARLRRMYEAPPIDEYLPASIYAIAYDVALEQICALLYYECGDAVGSLFPESIGTREDVELQFEHARVFREGTRLVSKAWFMHQLRPGLRFFGKGEAVGTELVDTLARTIGDHAAGHAEHAVLWGTLAPKLYCYGGGDLEHGKYRVFPPVEKENAPSDKALGAPFGTKTEPI